MSVEIVAEISSSHCGDLDRCYELIQAAKDSGADTVKFQCWTDGQMCLDLGYVISSGPWKGRNLAELYAKAWTPHAWFLDLDEFCGRIGIDWFASVFDISALAFLQSINCPRYKISSFEVCDSLLVNACAMTRKPIIISTGMASQNDIHQAVSVARMAGCLDMTLLKCTSAYPSRPEDAGLSDIKAMWDRHNVPVGLSDHSPGHLIPVLAVALGARMIEKHISIVDGDGLDDGFALSPAEFGEMVQAVRIAEKACKPCTVESESAQRVLRRSLYVCSDVKAGDKVTHQTVRSARPADGLSMDWHPKILGLTFNADVVAGTPLSLEMLVR